jgi:CRISPR-associated protein Cst2
MRTIQGFVMMDVDAAALNNAGKDNSAHNENAVATKTIVKNGKKYPYVSGQAWRLWWRTTLQQQFAWELSPVTRENKIAFTEANPMKFPDDDLFGYMRAEKKKGKDVTITRKSPLKNSALLAVSYNPVARNFSTMARHEGDSVPYVKEEYCAIMKGMFSLDVENSGVFSGYKRTGFENLTPAMREDALKNYQAMELDDPFHIDEKGNPLKLIALPSEVREKRIKDTIAALKVISGGAMLTNNYADVSPSLIVLAEFSSGNHPFSHLAFEEAGKAIFSIESLKEALTDYKDSFMGKIYVGKRHGFMNELNEPLRRLADENDLLFVGTVAEAIAAFNESFHLG